MPDYSLANAPWIGATLPQLVAKRQQENDAHQRLLDEQSQRQLENNLRAKAAADAYTKQRDYAAGIDQLTKQYPQGGPDFDRAMALLALKTTGPTAGEAQVSARSLFAPQDYVRAVPPPMAPAITAPPGVSVPQMPPMPPGMNAPAAVPPPQATAPIAAPPVAAPIVPPVTTPGVPTSFRAIQAAEKAKEAEAALELRRQAQASLDASRSNSVALRRDRLANTESNQTANLDLKKDSLANRKANQSALRAQQRADLAFRNKALAATIDGRKLNGLLTEAKGELDPQKSKVLFDRANAFMDQMGVADVPATDSPPDRDSQPPAAIPTATNPKTGEKVQLINGKWQPVEQ